MLSEADKILIVSPHPDDEAIGCPGLITKAKILGLPTKVLYVTTGVSRQTGGDDTIASVRENEISQVADYGKFEYSILFKNKYFVLLDTVPQKEISDLIEDNIEDFKPSILAIPFRHSYNQDHRAVFTACMTATRPMPENLKFSPNIIVEYSEPYSWAVSESFQPNIYLNIEGLEGEALKLMQLHASQDRVAPHSRCLENLERIFRIRGAEVGLDAAEAYRLLRYCR